MKNKVLNFTKRKQTIEGIEFEVPDYFSKSINVKDFFDNMKDVESFYIIKKIEDDDRIERIQYEYYEDPSYWDLILLINGMEQLFDMPMQENLSEPLTDKTLKEREKFRYLKIVPKALMPELISRLKRQKIIE